jgi:hypothetical protein
MGTGSGSGTGTQARQDPLSATLPLFLPIPANVVTTRQAKRAICDSTIVKPPVIFEPRSVHGVSRRATQQWRSQCCELVRKSGERWISVRLPPPVPVCTENLIRVADVTESPKLAE